VQQSGNSVKALVDAACAATIFDVQQLIGHLQNALSLDAGAQQHGQQLGVA